MAGGWPLAIATMGAALAGGYFVRKHWQPEKMKGARAESMARSLNKRVDNTKIKNIEKYNTQNEINKYKRRRAWGTAALVVGGLGVGAGIHAAHYGLPDGVMDLFSSAKVDGTDLDTGSGVIGGVVEPAQQVVPEYQGAADGGDFDAGKTGVVEGVAEPAPVDTSSLVKDPTPIRAAPVEPVTSDVLPPATPEYQGAVDGSDFETQSGLVEGITNPANIELPNDLSFGYTVGDGDTAWDMSKDLFQKSGVIDALQVKVADGTITQPQLEWLQDHYLPDLLTDYIDNEAGNAYFNSELAKSVMSGSDNVRALQIGDTVDFKPLFESKLDDMVGRLSQLPEGVRSVAEQYLRALAR